MNNVMDENKDNNLNNNYVQEKEISEIKDNNIENNLEATKIFEPVDESKPTQEEQFINAEVQKEKISMPESNKEKIDAFEKEFESLEEPISQEPKVEILKRENLVTTQTNKQEKEEEEEEIEIL